MKAPRFLSIASGAFCRGTYIWLSPESLGADAVLGLMRSVHFDALGFNRTYWHFL